MASLIKATSDHVPPGQAVFFRAFFALPVIVVWLACRHELTVGLKTANPMAHVWRGLVGTTAMGLMFTGLGLLPLPEVTAIGYAAPILVVIFAAMFLGEQVRAFRLSMVALGSRACSWCSRRGCRSTPALPTPPRRLAPSSCCWRPSSRRWRRSSCARWCRPKARRPSCSTSRSRPRRCRFLTLPWGWAWPPAWVLRAAGPGGASGGVGQILLTSSYRHADASLIAPFEYASMLLAIIVGYAVFSEVPDAARC
jgi:drug/metabolite transporter (DMT)-like permease